MILFSDFGSRCDPNVSGTPESGYRELVKTHSFAIFWPVLYATTHLFWVPVRYERFGNPGVRLRGTHENSQFWPIPASFVCYYSLILGPAAIRTFWEPRGPVTGNSSKLTVLVYSGSFVNYYSLILGPAAIRTFQEPWCLVTWNSSKHAVLAYCG